MSTNSKPRRAFVVESPPEGSQRKPFFHCVGTVFLHQSGKGFDLVIPEGISVSGRIVCLAPKAEEVRDEVVAAFDD